MPKKLLAMIRVIDGDAPGAVELLDQQYAHHGMGQGQVGEANSLVGGLLEACIQPIRTADHDGDIVSGKLPGFEMFRQRHGGDGCTALIQRHNPTAPGNGAFYAGALCRKQVFKRFGAARFGLDRLEFNLQLRRKAFGIVVVSRLSPIGHFLANGYDREPHSLRGVVFFATDFLAAGFLAVVVTAVFLAATFLATGILTTGVLTSAFLTAGLVTSGEISALADLRALTGLASGSVAGVLALRLAVQSCVFPTRPT